MSTRLHFELTTPVIVSANHRLHWAKKAEKTRHLRTLGQLAARGHTFTADRASLLIEIGWPDKRRRDAENLAPTVKALTDGLIDGGLLPDDNDLHIVERIWRTHVTPGAQFTSIDLTFTPAAEEAA